MADEDSQSIAAMAAALARKKASKKRKENAATTHATADPSSSSSNVTIQPSSLPQSPPPSTTAAMDIAALAAAVARKKREQLSIIIEEKHTANTSTQPFVTSPPPPSSVVPRLPLQQLQREVMDDENDNNTNDGDEDARGALFAAFTSRRKTPNDCDEFGATPATPPTRESSIYYSDGNEAVISPREALLAAIRNGQSESITASVNNETKVGGNNNVIGRGEELLISQVSMEKEDYRHHYDGGIAISSSTTTATPVPPSMSIAAVTAAAAKKAAAASPPRTTAADNNIDGETTISIADMAATAAQKKALSPPKVADSECVFGPPTSIATMAAAAAQNKADSTPKEADRESYSAPPISIVAIAAAAAQTKALSPRAVESSNSDGAPSISIDSMTVTAAQKKALSPKVAESEIESESASLTSIAAMAAAAAQKKAASSKSLESDRGPPMSVATSVAAQKEALSLGAAESSNSDGAPSTSTTAMAAAAAAQKKAQSPEEAEIESDSGSASLTSIAAMAAAAAQKEAASSKSLESISDRGIPMSIIAIAATQKADKNDNDGDTLMSVAATSESDSVAPMSVAAMAAAAAQKKVLSSRAESSESDGGPPMSIVTSAAAATQKKASTLEAAESKYVSAPSICIAEKAAYPESTDSISDSVAPTLNIAAMAAAAAQKSAFSPPEVSGSDKVGATPMSIAAMAVASRTEVSESEKGGAAPMSMAAIAAAASQKKASTQKAADHNCDTVSPLSIADMAAAAAQKKASLPKSPESRTDGGPPMTAVLAAQKTAQSFKATDGKGSNEPPIAIAATAAAASQNIAFPPKASDSDGDGETLLRIAEMVAAAAQNKALSPPKAADSETDCGPPVSIAAMAAAAARNKMSSTKVTEIESSAPMNIITTVAAAAQKNAASPKSADSENVSAHPVNIAALAAAAAQRKIIAQKALSNAQTSTSEKAAKAAEKKSFSPETPNMAAPEARNHHHREQQQRRQQQFYEDVDNCSIFSDDCPSDDIHDWAAQELLRVIRMKNLDFNIVMEKLESLNCRQSNMGFSHGGEKKNRRQERRCNTTDPLSTPKNDVNYDDDGVYHDDLDDFDDATNGYLSNESADYRRLAKNVHKLANHIMQTPQEEFASKKIPLKEDPEFNLYFRMLRYGFSMGAVRAALARDGKPDITRLDPNRPLCVQKVPRALDRFNQHKSIKVSGLDISHDGITDESWENALSTARESSDLSLISSPRLSLCERTPKNNQSGRISPATPVSPPLWLRQNQADRGIVQGWLRKKTRRGRWVRRWYYLDATGIYYSHAPSTSRSTSSKFGKYKKVADTRSLRATKSHTNPLEFELWLKSKSSALVTLRAHSVVELNEWVDAVSSAIERQRLVDEVVVGHIVPVTELRNKIGIQGGGLFGEDETGGGGGDYMNRRNIRSSVDGDSIGDGGGAVISAAALDEVKRLFTLGSGPLAPNISLPRLKRPRLKRQNSWPPISQMSNGDLALGGELSSKKIDDDLVKISDGRKNSAEKRDSDLNTEKSQTPKKEDGGTGDGEPPLKEDKRYAKYFNMMKMGLPKEAAKHAMKRDGIEDDTILDLDPEKSLKSQQAPKKEDTGPPLKEDKHYAKYFKMMKMGLPKEAAKHAMKRDGIEDDTILDLDPEKSLKSQQAPKEEDTGPPLKEDKRYAKYFKMMKMGLPKEAAKHAMKRDGIEDDTILDLDPEKSLKSQQAPKEEDTGPPLKEDKRYAKYFNMMKMGLPKEAAKHAMKRDGIEDDTILDLDPEKSLKSQQAPKEEDTGPPLKEDKRYAKYFNMMKMGLPKEAAKHAMKRDGIEDDTILDLDPEKSLKSQQAPKEEDTGPPLKEDKRYAKYFKMMKMGLPKEAAKHAMVRDQIDPNILDLDPEKSLKSQLGGGGNEDTGYPLKDDPKFAKYFKMVKMGLPMGAVKNALIRDGLDPGIMDFDHDKSVASQLDAKNKSVLKGFKMNKKPKIRRKKVYWTQIDAKEGTVWQAVKNSKMVFDIDIDEFEALFTQAVDADKEKEKKEKESTKFCKKMSVKVIDSKRGMNGDIILRKVKLSPIEVATLIENMDVGSLDAVELKSLYEFMPTDEEMKALTSYLESSKDKEEEISYMTPCEQYMVAMKDLKDSDKKFQCIIFLSDFGNKLKELKWDVDHLKAACEQLKSSTRFRSLLKMILILVNKINTGDEGGAIADGFTLETLAKLNETKAFDNKTTVLYYLVKLIRRTNIDVLKFTEDIKDVVLAKGVVMERLLTSAKQLCEDAKVAEETAIKDGDLYRQSLKDPSQQWKFTNKFTNVKAQRGSVKEIRQMATFLSEQEVPVCNVDSTHFERFASFAKLELKKAMEVIKEVSQQYVEILEFFGEDEKTQVSDFFGLIDQFMIAFDHTLDQVEKEEEEKLKEARRALAKEAKLKVKAAFKNAADATRMADETSSKEFPSRKFLRRASRDDSIRLEQDPDGMAMDVDSCEKSGSDGDSRQALFAPKSRNAEKEQQGDNKAAASAASQQEKVAVEDANKEEEDAKLAEIQRKENIKKLEEEAARERLQVDVEFENQRRNEHERQEKAFEMREVRIAQGQMEWAARKEEQEAAHRAKLKAEEERKRRETELRARIDAIERAREEEEERNERARQAEEERKREKLERRKREQDELRAKIDAEAMARKELEDRRLSIKQRHKAKEDEKFRIEQEAREQKKRELRAMIMAEEKAQRDIQERKRREMELRARIMEKTRKLQEDNIEDDLRAWLAKKEKLKSSMDVASSNKLSRIDSATRNNFDEKELQSWISMKSKQRPIQTPSTQLPAVGSTCKPKPSGQPSRLSMAVAQAAAAKQRRETAVATESTLSSVAAAQELSQKTISTPSLKTAPLEKSDNEVKEDEELMAWLKKRTKKPVTK